jgi:hypothetical protein
VTEPEDLLGKADAFLKRYHPSSAPGRHDVPVLTEVIAEGREPQAQSASGASAQAALPNTDLLELEQRLKQSIVEAVAAQVAQAVDEQIKGRLKTELELLIREAVARAVATEMARLRGPSRGA